MNSKTSRPAWALAALSLTLLLCLAGRPLASGQGPEQSGDAKSREFVVESYYRAKWGQADEFLRLYKKNHLPVLKKLKEEGRILRIEAVKPRYHATEDSRWDYLVTLTFRDAAAAHDPPRGGHQAAALSRAGSVPERGAAPVRDPRLTLGRRGR